jgi:hypothetical protein
VIVFGSILPGHHHYLRSPHVSAWEFGWNALVALGTLGLAIGTVGLAIATYLVARRTKDVATATQQEIAADWRPVLLLDVHRRTSTGNLVPAIGVTNDGVDITITNCGRGPALDVSATLLFADGENSATESRVAIAPGSSYSFYWESDDPSEIDDDEIKQMGRVSYADLTYAGYETTFAITKKRQSYATLDWQRVDGDPSYQAPLYGP